MVWFFNKNRNYRLEITALKGKLKAISKELINRKREVEKQDIEIILLNKENIILEEENKILLEDIATLQKELKITIKVKEGLQLAINKVGGEA